MATPAKKTYRVLVGSVEAGAGKKRVVAEAPDGTIELTPDGAASLVDRGVIAEVAAAAPAAPAAPAAAAASAT